MQTYQTLLDTYFLAIRAAFYAVDKSAAESAIRVAKCALDNYTL